MLHSALFLAREKMTSSVLPLTVVRMNSAMITQFHMFRYASVNHVHSLVYNSDQLYLCCWEEDKLSLKVITKPVVHPVPLLEGGWSCVAVK